MTPSIAMGERAVPVLMRATDSHSDGRIDLLFRSCPKPILMLPTASVRVVSTKALEIFVDKRRQAEFEREIGKVQPRRRDNFLYFLKLMWAFERGGRDKIEEFIRQGIEKKHLTNKVLANPLKWLGQALNFGVKDVVFVIWWSDKEKRFAPGLLCPDAITALHILALTWVGKRGDIAACARCGTTFIRSRRLQTYCKGGACQQASAVARSRKKRKDSGISEGILPDLLESDLDIVFCGTAPGEASAERAAYYAGPGNRFWPVLHEIGLTPRQFAPEDFRQLLDLRIGLTDLVKTSCGNDCDLSKEGFDRRRLRELVSKYHPRILAFTSKRAAEEFLGHPVAYGRLPEKEADTILFALPSPSGNARRYWSEQPWVELSQLRQNLAPQKD